MAARKRKRRKNRKVSQSSQSADTEEEGDEPKESPSGSLPRIDLGLPPVPPIGEAFFTGDGRMGPTEHTEYTEEFEQEETERTEDGRLTEDGPQRGARGAEVGF